VLAGGPDIATTQRGSREDQVSMAGRGNNQRLDADALAAISAYGARAHWPEGFSIYEKGSAADGMFVVLSGSVVLRTAKGKRRFVPAIAFASETFGLEGLTPGLSYVTDAQSAEASDTLHINGSRFRALLREQPTCALAVIAQAFAERAALLERMHEFSASSVDERMTSALLRLFEGRTRAREEKLLLRPADHRLLCEMVGATRESITHALARLIASGVAEREGSTFVLSRSALLNERRAEPVRHDRHVEQRTVVETRAS
jgi:CRP/FNR family cyclic AMP-dependent transcriptional regulator